MSSRLDISLWVDGHLATSRYGLTRSLGCQCCILHMALDKICCHLVGLYLDNILRRVYCNYLDWRFHYVQGVAGGAMVLGKLPVPGRPTIWIIVGQGPIALAVGVGGGCLDIFALLYLISSLSPSLWEKARYRLKYCLKGPLNPKQPTNQHYVQVQGIA